MIAATTGSTSPSPVRGSRSTIAAPAISTNSRCDHETTAKVLLVADGVFQAAGVIAMIDGIFQPSTHRVISRSAKVDTKVHVRPTVASASPGVSVFGHF
jgi:hypothetical protein